MDELPKATREKNKHLEEVSKSPKNKLIQSPNTPKLTKA